MRYYTGPSFALRLAIGFGILNSQEKTNYKYDSLNVMQDRNISLSSAGIGVGFEKHLASSAPKVDPYFGLQANFGWLGDVQGSLVSTTTGTNFTKTVDNSGTLPGGKSYGGSLLVGFNYFFSQVILP